MSKSYVIVGASAAGVAAANELRTGGFEGEITLVDADPEIPYERPPLSKSLMDPTTARPRPIIEPSLYEDLDVNLRLSTQVRAIDIVGHSVELADGERLPADKLLLATGARPRRSHAPGADLDGVLQLRTFADSMALGEALRRREPLVVVGGGFIGLEIAAVARKMGINVTVVEAEERPLVNALGDFSSSVLEMHREHGVRILTSMTVEEFVGTGSLEGVLLSDGTRVACGAAVVGIGVIPNDNLAQEAGLECDRGVVVDLYGRTSVPWIHAAGDVANQPHPALSVRGRIEHWDTAQRHGVVAAASMDGRPVEMTATPYFWSEHFGRTLQMFGRPLRGDILVMRPNPSDSSRTPSIPTAFWTRGPRLVAAAAVDNFRELRSAKALIESGVAIAPESLADPATDIRKLVRSGTLSGANL